MFYFIIERRNEMIDSMRFCFLIGLRDNYLIKTLENSCHTKQKNWRCAHSFGTCQ